ncbi:hypothetical protein [Aeromicrobium sp. UC242_57]|uniref:hypothetical protein n=1 Tax=Aeromicrobium sp. UC242_57 TaxID=3374624 RepID=UPI00379973EB
MSKHPFRWENLVFALFFAAVVGSWAVWERDLLTPRELSLTAAGTLLVLGVLGAAATLWPTRTTTLTTSEGASHEEADPQP